MRQLVAFVKKEWMEVIRNGKFTILIIVFILFGVMNPAIAKLTPWLMENFSESLEESGIIIGEVTVDAMTSWTQYYKNVPMAMIVFLLMFSGILVVEYQRGTLINVITKGMARWKIIVGKSFILTLLWSVNYWMCYGITYAYNAYFWDNSIAEHVAVSAFCVYLLGIWLLSLMMLMSVLFDSAAGVTVGTGAVFFVSYMLSMVPDLQKYLPTKLMESSGLLSRVGEVEDFYWALGIVVVLIVIQLVGAILLFNRKRL
ncbi:MAG: ABC transporter permease [Lachnospiraceae bacterium]|nr:ABC transporter permease [Lachnospiraceae bacterium]